MPQEINAAYFQQTRKRDSGTVNLQWKPSDELEFDAKGLYIRENFNNFNQSMYGFTSQTPQNITSLTPRAQRPHHRRPFVRQRRSDVPRTRRERRQRSGQHVPRQPGALVDREDVRHRPARRLSTATAGASRRPGRLQQARTTPTTRRRSSSRTTTAATRGTSTAASRSTIRRPRRIRRTGTTATRRAAAGAATTASGRPKRRTPTASSTGRRTSTAGSTSCWSASATPSTKRAARSTSSAACAPAISRRSASTATPTSSAASTSNDQRHHVETSLDDVRNWVLGSPLGNSPDAASFLNNTYALTQKSDAAYAQANFGGDGVRGNFGVRFVHTEIESSGYNYSGTPVVSGAGRQLPDRDELAQQHAAVVQHRVGSSRPMSCCAAPPPKSSRGRRTTRKCTTRSSTTRC